jgi:hypothetical protein
MQKCECHDEEMVWQNRTTRKGYWLCAIKKKNRKVKYLAGPAGKAARKQQHDRYVKTENGKASKARRSKRWNQSGKGKISHRKYELRVMRAKYTQQLEEIRNGR